MFNTRPLNEWAKSVKRQTLVVYFAARDRRTPIAIRILAVLVAAYALSPIDLIPDFIPVIGYLDDLLLLPLGIALIIKFTPPEVIQTAKTKAAIMTERPTSRTAAIVIITIWLVIAFTTYHWLTAALR